MIVIAMGVAGSGKTTVGKLIAERLGWQFEDADDYHSDANKAKMRSGQPLDDHDREPWLNSLREMIEDRLERNASTVVACSALKSAYREMLVPARVADSRGGTVFFLYLKASFDEITSRLAQRKHEFMNPALLKSQFQTLEEPTASKVVRRGDEVLHGLAAPHGQSPPHGQSAPPGQSPPGQSPPHGQSHPHGQSAPHGQSHPHGQSAPPGQSPLVETLVVDTDGLTAQQVADQAIRLLNQG